MKKQSAYMDSSSVPDIRQLCDIAKVAQPLWECFLTSKMEMIINSFSTDLKTLSEWFTKQVEKVKEKSLSWMRGCT